MKVKASKQANMVTTEMKSATETHDGDLDDVYDKLVIQTLPPSHILQDGRFVNLPEPTDRERVRFFERSIAKHKLLDDDINGKKSNDSKKIDENDESDESSRNKTSQDKAPQIHPLALASAKLQADGVNELNRAINLQNLASNGEYFGLSNIVDTSLELISPTATVSASATSASDSTNKADGGDKKGDSTGTKALPNASVAAALAAEKLEAERELLQEQRLKAIFILKRKRLQFLQVGKQVLRRHRRRLTAAIVAQSLPDQRLRQLRPFWRLVAPEHGSRALPHAARPTEVVAADVDVYKNEIVDSINASTSASRLAVRVPRYATMEIQDDYDISGDVHRWKKKFLKKNETSKKNRLNDTEGEPMEIDQAEGQAKDNTNSSSSDVNAVSKSDEKVATKAEPFAIIDPALGKMGADFDPSKVTMLTLQIDIIKQSTGFVQMACLEPIETTSNLNSVAGGSAQSYCHKNDEKLLVALQHSLFCAKLFESIRRELAPDTEDIGNVRTTARQSVVWFSGETEENFLPCPSLMSGNVRAVAGSAPICVVHVHEGDVKILLDSEYALRIRLVEAGSVTGSRSSNGAKNTSNDSQSSSGSQSPARLLALCHALLLHAQETYHHHSMDAEALLRKEEEQYRQDAATLTPFQLQQKQQAQIKQQMMKRTRDNSSTDSPRILSSCVALGSKLLFERRIRKVLKDLKLWMKSEPIFQEHLSLIVEWLPLSIFDYTSHFTLTYKHWSIDATIVGDEMTVTQFNSIFGCSSSGVNNKESYRKVKFCSDKHFELFMKMSLRRIK
jgi:hypothetical protein